MSSAAARLSHRRKTKREISDSYLSTLLQHGDVDFEAPGFEQGIRQHFDQLPTRYALDVNMHTLDVLSHKRLLDEARTDPSVVSFAVRPVEIVLHGRPSSPPLNLGSQALNLPVPAFGSSPNLQAVGIDAEDDLSSSSPVNGSPCLSVHENNHLPFYEITVASVDQPKLLCRLTDALGDLGLNIREAHVFNTYDGYVLDVFVVDWISAETGSSLEEMLAIRLSQMPAAPSSRRVSHEWDSLPIPLPPEPPLPTFEPQDRPSSPAVDDWEIDTSQLQIDAKIAQGAFSNLYKGSYCGQEVAVKILKDVQDDRGQHQEFLQEVSIIRKVRHKNVVQFIGACTRRPNLCIVFEFMSGGSVYDYVRREGPLSLAHMLKLLTDVSRGMDYLHQRKIIHRDLKAANLLMDDGDIVKIADFGVARIIEEKGIMTAETGTYRWMAPEVIEHKPYDTKADIFSFGIVIWELLTCQVPYADMTPLQAAVGVVQKGLRPEIPPTCPPALGEIMQQCWAQSPTARPSFTELTRKLQALLEAVKEDEHRRAAALASAAASSSATFVSTSTIKPGLLSRLKGKKVGA